MWVMETRTDTYFRYSNERWSSREWHELQAELSLLLAEHLPPDYASANMNRHVMKKTPEGKLGSAWAHLEYSLSQTLNLSEESRRDNISLARFLLEQCMQHSGNKTNEKVRLEAAMLNAQLPLFACRAFDINPTQEIIYDTYRSMGAAIDYVYRGGEPPDESGLPSQCAEGVVTCLAARTGQPNLLLYMSSPREEHSHYAKGNHDCYRIDNNQKTRVQVKIQPVDREQERTIRLVVAQDLVAHANKTERRLRAKNDSEEMTDITNYSHILALVVAESKGRPISTTERHILNAASTVVVSQILKEPSEVCAA